MKLSDMREILTRERIQLTKSLGQNFLHDANQLRRIVDAAEVGRADKVLEVGPGMGPLTELLVERAGHVLAIEKDLRLVRILENRIEAERLRLVHDDALEFLRREPHDWSDWKLVANLPYSVASPILIELARGEQSPRAMTVTLQWEVARRLMATAGDKDYGVLTLLVQVDFEPCETFKIPRGCFFPEPDVDSACVTLRRREKPLVSAAHRQNFVRLVKRAFSQRRKMMLKLLKQDWPAAVLEAAYRDLDLAPSVRAEAVPLDKLAALACGLRGRI